MSRQAPRQPAAGRPTPATRHHRFLWPAAGLALVAAMTVLSASQSSAGAAQPPVDLGTASNFAVLAATPVTNTGPSVITGDLGVSPGTAVTGFPPGVVTGAQQSADAVALQAQSDLTTAYNDAAGRTPASTVSGDLGGQTLTPGVYNAASSLGLTGTLTLDAQGRSQRRVRLPGWLPLITASASYHRISQSGHPDRRGRLGHIRGGG
jgi:Ice-binding-like